MGKRAGKRKYDPVPENVEIIPGVEHRHDNTLPLQIADPVPAEV